MTSHKQPQVSTRDLHTHSFSYVINMIYYKLTVSGKYFNILPRAVDAGNNRLPTVATFFVNIGNVIVHWHMVVRQLKNVGKISYANRYEGIVKVQYKHFVFMCLCLWFQTKMKESVITCCRLKENVWTIAGKERKSDESGWIMCAVVQTEASIVYLQSDASRVIR